MAAVSNSPDPSWFTEARFGLFIHWGLYALAARHEWVQSAERTPADEYAARYFDKFDPDLYDPDAWAEAAADAGMRYFVVTTKHHDGFCLWDSDLTDYKAPLTPAGRDLIQPMVDAFRRRQMRVGFYHSLIDWHHPDFVVDTRFHPLRDRLAGGETALNEGRDQSRYIEYLHGQVRELLTRYGEIDLLWFDFSFPFPEDRTDFTRGKGREAWGSERLLQIVRELQPQALVTDRLDLDQFLSGGDFKTPEQAQPRSWVHVDHRGEKVPVVWEACQTFSGSWGYYRDEHSWRTSDELIRTLVDCVSKGGNLLLNVGPTGRGEFDERALSRLRDMGRWMRRHNRAIYGCTQAPAEFKPAPHTTLTYHPGRHRLYVHLNSWPYRHVHLEGQAYTERVEYAQFLHDASEIKLQMNPHAQEVLGSDPNVLSLELPTRPPEDNPLPVIELFLKA